MTLRKFGTPDPRPSIEVEPDPADITRAEELQLKASKEWTPERAREVVNEDQEG